MDGILRKMLDKNKKVQEAGASAMANLEEKAGKELGLLRTDHPAICYLFPEIQGP